MADHSCKAPHRDPELAGASVLTSLGAARLPEPRRHMSYRQHRMDIEGRRGFRYRDHVLAPTRVLISDPFRFGLPEILTVAHT